MVLDLVDVCRWGLLPVPASGRAALFVVVCRWILRPVLAIGWAASFVVTSVPRLGRLLTALVVVEGRTLPKGRRLPAQGVILQGRSIDWAVACARPVCSSSVCSSNIVGTTFFVFWLLVYLLLRLPGPCPRALRLPGLVSHPLRLCVLVLGPCSGRLLRV
jgi:hypothetical protein